MYILECYACTFHNPIGNNVCEICETSLSSARKVFVGGVSAPLVSRPAPPSVASIHPPFSSSHSVVSSLAPSSFVSSLSSALAAPAATPLSSPVRFSLISSSTDDSIELPLVTQQPLAHAAPPSVTLQSSHEFAEQDRKQRMELDAQEATIFRDWTTVPTCLDVVHDCSEDMLINCKEVYPVTEITNIFCLDSLCICVGL